MVSRRNYLTMIALMAVIFSLFFFMGTAKDQWNDYQNNPHIDPNINQNVDLLTADSAWDGKTPKKSGHTQQKPGNTQQTSGDAQLSRNHVIYLGNLAKDPEGNTIRQWCKYSKRYVQDYPRLADLAGLEEETPEVLLINPDYLEAGGDTELLRELAGQGISMIFCHLPEPEALEKDGLLREFLGIQKIAAASCHLEGIKLFGGFLLGGEVHYIAEAPGDEARQDMTLEVPWYQLGYGTKTYMVGMLEKTSAETVKNEQLPALIWRASWKEAKVFAVNGAYLTDVSGVGVLSAMMAELHSYELYPVVNAQTLALVNAPNLASENEDQIMQLYSRSTRMLLRDVVFPGLAAISEVQAFPMTCLMTDRIMEEGSRQAVAEDLVYYLKYLNERKWEMGISLFAPDGEALADRAEALSDILTENNILYPYCVLYVEEGKLEEAAALLAGKADIPALRSVKTVFSEGTGKYDLLDYMNATTTIQGRTHDGASHTYMDDFRLRALETGLGYTSIFLNLKKLVYPEAGTDYWENLSVAFSSGMNTYWKPFQAFERMVAFDSDKRVRSFLALDYADSRSGDTIHLKAAGFQDAAWFVLRTHGEEIEQVEGASFEKIEKDVYLLTVTEPQVEITLKQARKMFYYDE